MIYPNTGTSAGLFGTFRDGVDARIGVENAKGGVNGRTISYDWADDRTDLRSNLAAAQSLVDDQRVFGLLEETSVAKGSAQWLNQQDVPVVGTSIELAWTQYRNMFSYASFVAKGQSDALWGRFMRAGGVTKAAVLYSSLNETSVAFRDMFVASLKAAGIYGYSIDAEPSSIDASSIAATMQANHIDGLIGGTDPTMFVTLSAVASANLKMMLGSSGYDQQVLDKAGKLLAGKFTVPVTYRPFEEQAPAHAEFLKAMAIYSPQLQPQTSEIALEGWIAADMFITGLQKAGPCVTRQSFMKALRGDKAFDAGGILPEPVDLNANFGKLEPCWTFVQVAADGNHWQLPKPAYQCGPLISQKPSSPAG